MSQVAVSVAFGFSVLVLVISTFRATKCDPMDPFVLRDESQFKEEDGFLEALVCDGPSVTREELEELPYCGLCGISACFSTRNGRNQGARPRFRLEVSIARGLDLRFTTKSPRAPVFVTGPSTS